MLKQVTLLCISAIRKFSMQDFLHSEKQLSEPASRDWATGTIDLAALCSWWPWGSLRVWLFLQELFSYWF